MKTAILFGASSLGMAAYRHLKDTFNVLCFCDNDPAKWGGSHCGLKIISPSQLCDYRNCTIIITSLHVYGISDQLCNMGIRKHCIFRMCAHDSYELNGIDYTSDADGLFDKNGIFEISPQDIEYKAATHYHNLYDLGKVLDGDWDTGLVRIDNNIKFWNSFNEHIECDVSWEDTAYFKRVMSEINSGMVKWGCRTRQEFLRKCAEWDSIYNDMRLRGYKQDPNSDYITINIGRDGRLIFNDGLHRLVMAKMLDITTIPVKVVVRHEKWVDFKRQVMTYAELRNNRIYAPISHIDFQNVKCIHDGRMDVILAHISSESKTVLDVGAHWGYCAGVLEKHGKRCTAVEIDDNNYHFLRMIKSINGNTFRAIKADIFEFIRTESTYDVVLALNIFHHFLKKESTYREFIHMLNALVAREMFFQAHKAEEPQMIGAYRNYEPDEFAQFIVHNSCFNTCRQIAEYNRRRLYHLTI